MTIEKTGEFYARVRCNHCGESIATFHSDGELVSSFEDLVKLDDPSTHICSSCRARCADCGKLKDRHAKDCVPPGDRVLAASHAVIEFMTLNLRDQYGPVETIVGALLGVARIARAHGHEMDHFNASAAAMFVLAGMMERKNGPERSASAEEADQPNGGARDRKGPATSRAGSDESGGSDPSGT